MKSRIASLEAACVVKELQFLISGKIDKIFQPKKNELVLQMHIPNLGKRFLRILSGKLIYLASIKESTEKPPGFCMYLRKHLSNSRIRQIRQIGFERIVEFVFETKSSKYSLIVELFGNGNIILLKDNIILSALEYKKWKDRLIMPKQEYSCPKFKYDFLKLKESDLIRLFEETNKESVVKCLALDLGLGGVYAEELCLRAKIDKNNVPKKFKKIDKLFAEIKNIRKLRINAFVIDKGKDIVPFDMLYYPDNLKEQNESYNSALDSVFTKAKLKERKKRLTNKQSKVLEKYERMIADQEKNIEKLNKDEDKNRKKGNAIFNNYQLINDIINELKKALKKYSYKEVKAKLKDHKIIKEFNTKDRSVVVELEE